MIFYLIKKQKQILFKYENFDLSYVFIYIPTIFKIFKADQIFKKLKTHQIYFFSRKKKIKVSQDH